jgi:hypothetical protein
MSYSLPKYYFQGVPADVMDEIMHGMQEALLEPSLVDHGSGTRNSSSLG